MIYLNEKDIQSALKKFDVGEPMTYFDRNVMSCVVSQVLDQWKFLSKIPEKTKFMMENKEIYLKEMQKLADAMPVVNKIDSEPKQLTLFDLL